MTTIAQSLQRWRPPEKLTLSQWAEQHYYLSAESAAEPGRWHTIPYQRGIMDAFTDPEVVQITCMKSARVGWTKIVNAAIGYFMHADPALMMVVQPTLDDARDYSKEELVPMFRDCPALGALIQEQKTRRTESTILSKRFLGGVIDLVGANSGTGFRRKGRRVVLMDEVDAYPASAGSDGDPVNLAITRTKNYANRKIAAGSTPLTAGVSRIAALFEQGDQRRYFVPCPQCGHMDILTFNEQASAGHFMKWPKNDPGAAYFVCRDGGCIIEHKDLRGMLEHGEWRGSVPFTGHASFHIWAAYSLSPNATWGQIAAEFVEAKRLGPEILKTFVNTVLGETWQDRGEAPDWERLFLRREKYPIGQVPEEAAFLTAGIDVQRDRFVYEVVAWAPNKENWSVDAGELACKDTADQREWHVLDELLERHYSTAAGAHLSIALMAVDSGYNTQEVYNWCRRYPMSRVIAVKGVSEARTLIGTPSPVDILQNGRRHQRGYRVWPVAGAIAKTEFYGWLRLSVLEGGVRPGGYCHFPEYDEEHFKQITSEHLVTRKKASGFTAVEWQVIPGRQNHKLDARVYARAAASVKGIDRHVQRDATAARPASSAPAHEARPVDPPAADRAPAERPRNGAPPRRQGWLRGGRPGGSWLGRR